MCYICRDCGNYFDSPATEQEDRGEYWGMPAFETMYYCPFCGSEDFDDAGIVLDELQEQEERELADSEEEEDE